METHIPDFASKRIEAPAARRGLPVLVWQALGYLLALTVAEVVTTLIEPRLGLALHGVVLVALITHASLTLGRLQGGFLLGLAFASLIRLMSLSTPLPYFPKVYWYMVIGAPLLLAAFLAARVLHLERKMIGIWASWHSLPGQALVGLSGLGLGFLEYLILRPDPLAGRLSFRDILIPALILLIFTGFLEEYIFRGLMQYTAGRGLGRFGLLYVALVFAVLHIGYRSVLHVIFVLVVALFFGYVTARTGSLLGVTLSHGLTNITLFLVFPFIAAQVAPGFGGVRLPATATPIPAVQATPALPTAPSPTLRSSSTSTPTASPSPAVTATQGVSSQTPTATASATSTPPETETPALTPTAVSPPTVETPTAETPPLSPTPGTRTLTPTPTATAAGTSTPPASETPIPPTPSKTTTPAPSPTPTPSPPPSPTVTPAGPSPTPIPEQSHIVDDGDPGFSTTGAPFNLSTQGLYGDMLWAPAAFQDASSAAEWGYPYQVCGRYELEVYIPASPGVTQSALYQIGYRSGMATRLVDQSAYPGKWVSLGEWEFLPIPGSFLRLANATGEDPALGLRVLYDAVRWRFAGPCQ